MEISNILFENESIKIVSIKSYGHKSKKGFWYDQEQKEIAYVTQGEALIEFFDGRKLFIPTGEHYIFLPHEKHRIAFTSNNCEWLCFFIKNQIVKDSI